MRFALPCAILNCSVAFSSPSNLPQRIIDFVVEGFFWLDLVLNFFQEYKDPETYENVRSHKKIGKHRFPR